MRKLIFLSINTKFIKYAFISKYFLFQIESVEIGGTITTISQTRIGCISLFLPMTDSEQLTIADYIENETFLIKKKISRIEPEIELIQEFLTRLLADVVNGKIYVRLVVDPDFEEDTSTDG